MKATSIVDKKCFEHFNQDSQELSEKQLRALQGKLLGLKTELADAIRDKAGDVIKKNQGSESVIKGDDAEVAEKQRQSNALLQELDILKTRLKLVQRALDKISEGDYGVCEETEEPIGFERLSVVPWARYSVHVQEMRERKMREFRISRLKSEL